MHYFPSIKMCYQLKHLSKMGVLCKDNKFFEKDLNTSLEFFRTLLL